jgi:hypothetical protein
VSSRARICFPARAHRRRRCALAVASLAALLASAARGALPPGWTVHTFTGRMHDIAVGGGMLACATDGGLLFFDPAAREYAPVLADAGCTDGECLTSNRLTAVSRDEQGDFWIGTEANGVVAYRPLATQRKYDRFFALSTRPGGNLLADSVVSIETWKNETVYVGTSRGVGQIDRAGGVDSYNPDAERRLGVDFKGNVLHDLAVDSLFVWVATDSGVSRYDRRPPYTVHFLPDSLAHRETYMVKRLGGQIYAGNDEGASVWQETSSTWRRIRNANDTDPTHPTTPTFLMRSLARLPDGRLAAGADGNVYFFNGSLWTPLYPPAIFLLNDRRFETVVTVGDTLWLNQSNVDGEGGFLETWSLHDTTWRRYETGGLPGSSVQVVAVAPSGTIWAGTRLAGIASLVPGATWCAYNGNDPVVRPHMTDNSGHVSALAAGFDERVWFHALPQPNLSTAIDVLTPGANCAHASDAWTHVAPGDSGFGCRYWKAPMDGDGNIFFLSDGDPGAVADAGGIDVTSADGSQRVHIGTDVLGAAGVGALAFETQAGTWGTAYLGLNNEGSHGLRRWTRAGQLFPPHPPTSTNFAELSLPDSYDVSQYRDIAVMPDSLNRIWVATGSGLFEYDVPSRSVLRTLGAKQDARPGLLSVDLKALAFDAAGNLWVASVKGVNRLRLADRQPGATLVIDAFTTIDIIRELNAASSAGQLYDPTKAVAPLPSAKVLGLVYDKPHDVLHIATDAGLATVDVGAISHTASVPLTSAILYPNPVRADAGHTEVRIAHISEPATVSIYTLEGQLVCEATDREDNDVVWLLGAPSCLETEGNYKAATGTYLVRIATRAGTTVRTLVVIR